MTLKLENISHILKLAQKGSCNCVLKVEAREIMSNHNVVEVVTRMINTCSLIWNNLIIIEAR